MIYSSIVFSTATKRFIERQRTIRYVVYFDVVYFDVNVTNQTERRRKKNDENFIRRYKRSHCTWMAVNKSDIYVDTLDRMFIYKFSVRCL